ncbi:unnamed protein product [Closterium sp. NIES-64]|nr:unnamed protein product [Closterium sp. NIES-64]
MADPHGFAHRKLVESKDRPPAPVRWDKGGNGGGDRLQASDRENPGTEGENTDSGTTRGREAPRRKLSQEAAEGLEVDWMEAEVKATFKAMAKRKSPGSDELPNELIEDHRDSLGSRFMALANEFASTASLPLETKEAVTILLHKKGDRESLNNYLSEDYIRRGTGRV